MSLSHLFRNEIRLRAVIDCVLEGHLGYAAVDDQHKPRVARLSLGCYAIFAGEPNAHEAEALVREVPTPLELVVPRTSAWEDLAHQVHGSALTERPMTSFSAASIDPVRARELASRVPEGYELRAIDARLAAGLGPELQPHGMQVMTDPADFAQRSGGVAAVIGDTIACAATNYAFAENAIELAIATHPEHRSKGLATCVASSWVAHCLERGITPHWNASNPVSKRLAERIGYVPDETVEVLYLDREA